MRYPIVNMKRRMGGMLEDYNNDLNRLKEKLYHPTTSQIPQYPEPEVMAREFPFRSPTPTGGGAGMPVLPGVSVTGGIPGPLPTNPKLPPLPTQYPGVCKSGESWIPGVGCVKNTPSVPDRPPIGVPFPPDRATRRTSIVTGMISEPPTNPPLSPVQKGTSGTVEQDVPCDPGYSRSLVPPYPCLKDVATGDRFIPTDPSGCAPGQFWDGRQCRGSVGTMPGGFGSFDGGGVQALSLGGIMGTVDRRILGKPLQMAPWFRW